MKLCLLELNAGNMNGFHVKPRFCMIQAHPIFFTRALCTTSVKRGLYFESNEDLLQGHEISILIKKPPQQFTIKPHQKYSVKIMWHQELQGSSYQIGYGAKIIWKYIDTFTIFDLPSFPHIKFQNIAITQPVTIYFLDKLCLRWERKAQFSIISTKFYNFKQKGKLNHDEKRINGNAKRPYGYQQKIG